MSRQNSTEFAVATQLAALAHGRYEVGISYLRPSEEPGGQPEEAMMIRRWTADEIERSMGFLKAKNLNGSHIYVRPEGAHEYSFVDDLNAAKVADMKAAGFPPALVVESSPGNYQAWVAHGQTLDAATSTGVAKALASRFGGDPSSADHRHFGRLVGFTNRKPKHQRPDGKYPFVRVIEATGIRAPGSPALIEQVRQELTAAREADEANRLANRAAAAHAMASGARLKPIEDFWNSPAYGGDQHRADLAYASYALSRGVPIPAIESAIASRDLSHKGGPSRQRDYIDRTIKRAQERSGPSR